MNRLFDEFYNFVINSDNPEKNVERILDYQCERLLQDYLITYAPYLKKKIDKYNSEQKIKNEIFSKEIINLTELFKEKNLKIINLKGISLLNELYSDSIDAYKKRKINDIDILISYDELEPALDILGRAGYFVASTKKKVSSDIIKEYYTQVDHIGIHFPEFEKLTERTDIKSIKMDCHISIIHTLDYKRENMIKIINRYEWEKFQNKEIMVLGIYDRLLHLIVHFTKENFRCGVRWYITGERNIKRNHKIMLPLLHEIAILLYNNKKKVDLNKLVFMANELNCGDEILGVFTLLKRVYSCLQYIENVIQPISNNFNRKYFELFYPLKLFQDSNCDILESKLSTMAECIMKKSSCGEFLQLNKQYDLVYDKENELVNRMIIHNNENEAFGKIKFQLVKNNFLIELKGGNFLKEKELYLTIGTLRKNEILSAYINKFNCYLMDSIPQYQKSITLRNGYIDLQIKKSVLINVEKNEVLLKLNKQLLGIDETDDKILINVGVASLIKKVEEKADLYKLNDISKRGLGDTFFFSPELLQVIKL